MDNAHTAVTLLPCPFCGWANNRSIGIWADGGFWAECPDCFAQGPVEGSEAEAIAAWNTRATTADLQARLEASEAECFKLAASVCIAEAVNAELVEGLERIEYQSTNHGGWFDQNGQQFAEYCKLGDIARQALTTTRNADAQGGG